MTGETKKIEFKLLLVRESSGDFLVLEIFSLILLAVLTKKLNMLAISIESATLTKVNFDLPQIRTTSTEGTLCGIT